MAKYEVVNNFYDGDDKDKHYEKGDMFPKPANKKVSKERLEQLSTTKNDFGVAFIKEVKEDEKESQ